MSEPTASRDRKILDLAAIDWSGKNPRQFEAYATLTGTTLSSYRATDEYKAAIADLREEWHEQMLRLPQTTELRKKINHAMSLSITTVIDILCSPASENKDKLAAARLASQWDGRFLHSEEDKENPADETVAEELLKAIKRHQDTVQ
jgi:hypothetical protein